MTRILGIDGWNNIYGGVDIGSWELGVSGFGRSFFAFTSGRTATISTSGIVVLGIIINGAIGKMSLREHNCRS